MPRILVIDAHPRAASYCDALATAYTEEARAAGAEVDRLTLRELAFDPILRTGYAAPQPLEPDLQRAQALISGASHLVLVTPIWWGAAPALLKGFLDRTLLPGFAFRYHPKGAGWDKLLGGRSARVIQTMDWPPLAFRLVLGRPAHKALGGATLAFCGFKPVRFTDVGRVKGSTPEQRAGWLEQVRATARKEARG
jgi:putative NADPH-quinone reductase